MSNTRTIIMNRHFLYISLLALLFTACHDDSSPKHIEGDLSLSVAEGWTFLSLETGNIVGTCALDDSLTLRQYTSRMDWDIAVSSDGHLRTNSGLSGDGMGGISESTLPFDATDALQEADYLPDTTTYEIW